MKVLTLSRFLVIALLTTVICRGNLFGLGFSQEDTAQVSKDRLIVETLLRLKGYDLESNAKAKQAVIRHVGRQRGTVEYVRLARHFKLQELVPTLMATAVKTPNTTLGAESATLVVELGQLKAFSSVIGGKVAERAARAIEALGHVDRPEVRAYLLPLVTNGQASRAVRNAAARALGRSRLGEKELLELARKGKVLDDTSFAVGNLLLASGDVSIRKEAQRYFKLPAGLNATPLPPIAQLLELKGSPQSGKNLFETTATCAKCHKVRGAGKEVGPDLSEIGSKLSKEALFVSILDPSAGISHNYETYLIELVSGNVLSGVVVSQTDELVVLKTKEAIEKSVDKDDIELMKKTEISLMPADIVKTMTKNQLADLVEYLTTLKKQK
jgi:putative heme-binding domain-containing protein